MTREDIINLIAGILEISYDEANNIKDDESLEYIGLTSIKAINLIVKIEKKLGQEFNNEDLISSKVDSINLILDICNKYENIKKNKDS